MRKRVCRVLKENRTLGCSRGREGTKRKKEEERKKRGIEGKGQRKELKGFFAGVGSGGGGV